ncbi:MAG: hypothetical protein M0D53_15170 [Flavobacterium sp. JAD_PAG50586_2]|nr:MAG: hypothetical protein M0D53_15170 [Flavobacterium sp. JAD_PAG50586_2]
MKDFKLDNEPKITSGFTTPDGYFDTFTDRISAKLTVHEPKVISIFSLRKTWYYAVAAILVLMLSIPLYTKYTTSQEIDAATLENYIAYQSNISEEVLVDLLEQEDLDKLKLELDLDDTAIEETLQTNPNLEQYLID